MNALLTMSHDLAAIVEGAGASVVRVQAGPRSSASGVVWTDDGLVVTAQHAIGREEDLSVGLPDGRTVPATLVGRDRATDLAVLRLEATGLAPMRWADPDDLRVGHLMLALGRPGRTVRAALGVVGALGPKWSTPAGGDLDAYLELDLRPIPGFSGGPLVDAAGAARGLTTAGVLPRTTIGVPTPTLRRVVDALVTHGRVPRGYLGVAAHPVALPGMMAREVKQTSGLMVTGVEPGSPADRGGLLLGDTIIGLGGAPVADLPGLRAGLAAAPIGAAVPVRLVRAGRVEERPIPVGERP